MTTKHTPGPWHVKPNSIGGPTVGPEDAVVADIRTYGGPHVGGQQHPQTVANASLIAAAPDLLEALQTLLGDTDDSDYMTRAEKEEKARAAIARTTGESK